MEVLKIVFECIIWVVALNVYHWAICRFCNHQGTFHMDFSDPNKDVCRLDFDEDINKIYKRKYIILKVETKDADSHE